MQINFLKKIVETTAGEQAVKIVELLYNKKDINEFLIAKKLGLTINQTRNLLYKLSNIGILTSTRKKDKRKGWYIYFWTFNVHKSLEVLANGIKSEIQQLESQLTSKKTKRFYKCAVCGREVNEETALLSNFTCTECGEIYGLADNAIVIEEIAKKIAKLQKELDSINKEIQIESENIAKKNRALNKRIDKKKKKERMIRLKKAKAKMSRERKSKNKKVHKAKLKKRTQKKKI
jgi:transcription factor E